MPIQRIDYLERVRRVLVETLGDWSDTQYDQICEQIKRGDTKGELGRVVLDEVFGVIRRRYKIECHIGSLQLKRHSLPEGPGTIFHFLKCLLGDDELLSVIDETLSHIKRTA